MQANHEVSFPAGLNEAFDLESFPSGRHDFMEERLASLETRVEHVQKDVSETKQDLRDFRYETNQKFLWVIGAIGTTFVTLLGFMARGFGWI